MRKGTTDLLVPTSTEVNALIEGVSTAARLNGMDVSEYRPAGADNAVDIRLRLPEDRRTLSTLDELRVQTSQGSVPISNFVVRKQIWAHRHPEKFWPEIDAAWQKLQAIK